MANVLIEKTSIENIADSIRGKNGSSDTYKVSEMAAAIDAITGGVEEIETEAEMDATLVAANEGNYYKFIGETTSKYKNGRLYLVENIPNYLCFTAKSDNTRVVVGVYSTTENVGSTISVDYSTDGSTWNTVTTGYEHFSDTTEARGFCIANLNTGDKIYFKNKVVYRPSDTTGKPSSTHYEFIKCFGAYPIIRVGENVQFWDGQSAGYTTDADVSGDISSLLNFKTVLEPTSQEKIEAGYSIWSGNGEGCGDEYAFYGLFNGWPALTSAANLILPYNTLLDYDYTQMFMNCTSLTALPTLPATTLAKSCYSSMFSGCTSLVNAPSLPATTLAQSCYGNMFYNCTALTVVPTLPATTLAQTCYSGMFRGCTALQVNDSLVSGVAEQAWTIPSTGTFTNTYSQSAMFTNCAGTCASNNMAGVAGQSYIYYTQNTPM